MFDARNADIQNAQRVLLRRSHIVPGFYIPDTLNAPAGFNYAKTTIELQKTASTCEVGFVVTNPGEVSLTGFQIHAKLWRFSQNVDKTQLQGDCVCLKWRYVKKNKTKKHVFFLSGRVIQEKHPG